MAGHRHLRGLPIATRLLLYVAKEENGCWSWTGHRDCHGYGRVNVGYRHLLAHRVSYETFVGSIPEGLALDHLCRNRACCNPEHLDPVTLGENVRRGVRPQGAHCKHGHKFTAANTYRVGARRACRTCRRGWARDWYRRRRRS